MQESEHEHTPRHILGKLLLPFVMIGIIAGMGGSIALGMLAVTNTVSQLAATGSVSATAPKTCMEAKKRALQGEKDNDGPARGAITGTSAGKNVIDKCYSAFMTEKGKQKKKKGVKLTLTDYECKGRKAVTNVRTGKVTDSSFPYKSASTGKCDRSVKNEKPKVPGQEKMPQSAQKKQDPAGGQQGKGEGMPQLPQIPPPSPKPPPPPPQPPPEKRKMMKCDGSGNCAEVEVSANAITPASAR